MQDKLKKPEKLGELFAKLNEQEREAERESIGRLHSEGYSSRDIAFILGISKSKVNYVLNGRPSRAKQTQETKARQPRVLLFDLENAPSIVATFGRYNVNIGPDSVVREGGFLLSLAWKYLGDKDVQSLVLTPDEALNGDDSRIVAHLYELYEETDVAVGHNIKRFDNGLFKSRLIANGMPPPKTVKLTDTLSIAKRMKFSSNKLDSLGNYLNVGRKINTAGMSLWLRCMNGDQEALQEMKTYNIQDVNLLEEVYLKLRPFDEHPANFAHFYDDNEHHCPACGSTDIRETGNSVYTPVSEFAEVVCRSCGHRSRKRQALNSKEERAKILITPN